MLLLFYQVGAAAAITYSCRKKPNTPGTLLPRTFILENQAKVEQHAGLDTGSACERNMLLNRAQFRIKKKKNNSAELLSCITNYCKLCTLMDIMQENESSTDIYFPLIFMALCLVKRRLTATRPPPRQDLHQPPHQLLYEAPAFPSRQQENF